MKVINKTQKKKIKILQKIKLFITKGFILYFLDRNKREGKKRITNLLL